MHKSLSIWAFLGLVLLTTGCQDSKDKLTIAVAANLQFVMAEIIKDYEKETGEPVDLVIGSSGKLYAQVVNGAPYDVFLAADTVFPRKLIDEGATHTDYLVFAHGTLVFWSADTLTDFPSVLLPKLAHSWKNTNNKWAIANPNTAPYGYCTKRYLERLEAYETLLPYQVQAESVSQVNQFVHAKSVAFGFTSLSSVIANQVDPAFWMAINPKEYPPLPQTAIVIKPSIKSDRFMRFLGSAPAIERLASQGYLIPKS